MPTIVTKTVKASGGDYTSLATWEAGEQGDLVSLDEIHEAACSNFVDTTACTISGSTTDATRYMRVYAADNHNGLYGTSSYRLESSGNGGVLSVQDGFARIQGLLVGITGDDNNHTGIMAATGDSPWIDRCIVKYKAATHTYGSSSHGINGGVDRSTNLFVSNCLVIWKYGATKTGNSAIQTENHTAGKTYLYNCTVAGDGFNVSFKDGYGDIVAKNCLSYNGGTDFSGVFDASSDYNASSDTTAPGTHSRVSQTFTFVDAATDDYHLASGDAGAKGFGTDLSADAHLAFSDDIDGDTRAAPWDIGMDQTAIGAGETATATATSTVSAALSAIRHLGATVAAVASGAAGAIRRRLIQAVAGGAASVSVAMGVIHAPTATARPQSSVSVSVGARRAETATTAAHATTSASVSKISAGETATARGTATVVASIGSRHARTATTAASATASASVVRRRYVSATVAGRASPAAVVDALRARTATVSGAASASASISKVARAGTATVSGQATVSAGISAKRSVTTQGAGTASVTASVMRLRNASASAAGQSSVTASVSKVAKSGTAAAASQASASATIAALRSRSVAAGSTATVAVGLSAIRALSITAGAASRATAGLATVAPVVPVTGKYQGAHDAALTALSHLPDFSGAHAAAVTALEDAGQ